MRSNYKKLGDFISKVDVRNKNLQTENLQGLSMTKEFRKSTSNIVGTNLKKYKIVGKNQFACDFMSVIRVHKLPVVLHSSDDLIIVSPAYTVFKIIDETVLNPEYLMMWFRRPEFDRYADFRCDSAIRGGFKWDELCETELPVPSIEKQHEIVKEYNVVKNRISLNEQLNQKLEETAQALYKHWFVDFEFPFNKESHPELVSGSQHIGYKSSGGKMVYNEELDKEIPEGWKQSSLKNLCQKIASGATPKGGKQGYGADGISLIRSMNVYDYHFFENNLAFIDENQADKLKNVTIQAKDILFNITGASVARCCIVPTQILPARINQHVMLIRLKNKDILNNYLLYNLCSNESKKELIGVSEAGSTRQAITKSEIESFGVLYPKNEVLLKFERSIEPIMENRNSVTRINNELRKLQDLLLSKMARVEDKLILTYE